tara:strand:+ start:389 stop:1531 length:1143 start_codon:yes stop_codon:yes gene_type:complete
MPYHKIHLKTIPLSLLIFLICLANLRSQDLNYVFKSGTNGYNTFRIPSIIKTKSGALLAFAEGRKNNASDSGDIDLVLRRSENNGKTWGDLIVIRDDGDNVCGNPSPVLDNKTGNIFLLSTWNLGRDTERMIINETSEDTRRIYVMSSGDDGNSWSEPTEITKDVKKDNWTWYATGPVHGIQIQNGSHKGRMIIPCDHIESKSKKYYSHIIFSDDGGNSWEIGGITPQDYVNECTVVEINKGKLLLNMRNYDRSQENRKISVSDDGGITWGNIYSDETLIEPICQASLLRYSFSGKYKKHLMFLNPSDKKKRINMTLKLSSDYGKTWNSKLVLHTGPSAYSDLTRLNGDGIGCLFEAGVSSPYEGIVFKEVKIDDLKEIK